MNWGSPGLKLNTPDMSIFVGDLPSHVTDIMLFHFYASNYPSCISAKIMVDPTTRLPRGYGFVKFGDPREAERAIRETNKMYMLYLFLLNIIITLLIFLN